MKLTMEILREQGLTDKQAKALLEVQSKKAPPRTHFKYWVYANEEQAGAITELLAGDPEATVQKYSDIRKARKAAKAAKE